MLKKLVKAMQAPCKQCPITLGTVKYVVNPCLVCREKDYATYYYLTKTTEKKVGKAPS